MVRHCPWKMCARLLALHQTGLFSAAAVVPQSKTTELCSSAAVVPQGDFQQLSTCRIPVVTFIYAVITFIYHTNHSPFPLNCYLSLRNKTGGLEARAERENEREVRKVRRIFSFACSRASRALVYFAGPANPPVLQAIATCTPTNIERTPLSFDYP